MNGLAALVDHSALEKTSFLEPMLATLFCRLEKKPSFFHHKNVHIGAAPLHDEKKIVLVFDGSLKNAKELSRELKALGHPLVFRDQDIVSTAYLHWGTDCFAKFCGSFACVIFDKRSETLIAARDRFGKKPLYWALTHKHLLLASELKAIAYCGLLPQEVNEEAIAAYLYFGFCPHDLTLFHGVHKLLPGAVLQYECAGNKAHTFFIKTPWSYSDWVNSQHTRTQEEYRDDIKQNTLFTLTDTLRLPIPDFDELLKTLVSTVYTLDEPLADPWSPFRAIALNGVHSKSLQSHLGFEEIFGTAQRYAIKKRLKFSPARLPKTLVHNCLFPFLFALHKASAWRLLRAHTTDVRLLSFLESTALFNRQALRLFSPNLFLRYSPSILIHRFSHALRDEDPREAAAYFDIRTSIPDRSFLECDRLGAAHKIHFDFPFLQEPLVKTLAAIPLSDKIACAHELFPTLCKHEKPSYPMDAFFQHKAMPSIYNSLRKGALVECGFISAKALARLVAPPTFQFQSAAFRERYAKFYAILALEVWMRLFILGPVPSSAPKISLLDFFRQTKESRWEHHL